MLRVKILVIPFVAVVVFSLAVALIVTSFPNSIAAQDLGHVAQLQAKAVETKQANWGHWGPDPEVYSSWTTHTNRLVPVYTFGLNLDCVKGKNSVYRNSAAIKKLYGYDAPDSTNPKAKYFDQTDIYRLQKEAIRSGKKRIILMVFDGMDWDTTRASAVVNSGDLAYDTGRGRGLHFLDYRGAETDYGQMVTSPHNDGTKVDVNRQIVTSMGSLRGGYNSLLCGNEPWHPIKEADYPIGKSDKSPHAYTDSAASATSMTSGIKTYNAAINVDPVGRPVSPIGRTLQEDGFAIGVVTSVPISHATPACAYANNVHRNEYQDLTRDLIGRRSVSHPGGLSGVDVLIGAGWGVERDEDEEQGQNYVPGNRYLTKKDLHAIDVANGGKYVVAQRTKGEAGPSVLNHAVKQAKKDGHRLFGFFGTDKGHLPYRTADGKFDPVASVGDNDNAKAEVYTPEDLSENVSLKQMALAAVDVLDSRSDRWWLMIEAGDVDWAAHANNIDNVIGAVISGDEAFQAVAEWVEKNGGWNETALILTADHGHYLVLDQPEALVPHSKN